MKRGENELIFLSLILLSHNILFSEILTMFSHISSVQSHEKYASVFCE